MSPGANGGIFGFDGGDPINRDAGMLFAAVQDEKAGVGGLGGEGIKVITGNSSYSNLASLLQYPDALTPTTANFPNLLAWFTSEDSSKLTTTTSGNYKYISKWESKNDSSIYITFPWKTSLTGNAHKPLFVEAGGATPNYAAYTNPFNNKDVVFFGANYSSGGKIEGLVKSGKLEMDMAGFEIIYFLYPGSVYGSDSNGNTDPTKRALQWGLSAFRLYKNNNAKHVNGALRLSKEFRINGSQHKTKYGPKGIPLHNWTFNQPQMLYYTDQGANMTAEGTGLINYKRAFFKDFTNGISPERAWMYSISASRVSGGIDYKIYNDLKNVWSSTNEFRGLRKFKWLGEPIIGINYGVGTPIGTQYNGFYGGISDILVFKHALTDRERAAVYSYIANKRLRVPVVKYDTVTSYSVVYKASLQDVHISHFHASVYHCRKKNCFFQWSSFYIYR